MPLDSLTFVKTAPAVRGREGLRQLARALREPMPAGFGWDFAIEYATKSYCGTTGCALGLAHVLWPERFPLDTLDEAAEREFVLTEPVVRTLFYSRATYSASWDGVTPPMVANAIDRYLSTGELS